MKALKSLMLLGVVAVVVLTGTSQVWALGADTNAGTSIDNSALLTFDAGQATGNTTSDTANFLVDRNVVFTNTNATAATVQAFPGDVDLIVQFDLQNDTNDVVDLLISPTVTGTAHSDYGIFADTGDATCTTADLAGTDILAAGYLDEVAEDATPVLCLFIDADSGAADGATTGFVIEAQAAVGGSVGVQGAALVSANNAAWQAGTVQNAFGDGAGYSDAQYDGLYDAAVVFEVVTANLTVAKTITAVNDSAAYTTIDKAIPGAVVSYRVVVDNPGSGTATNVSLTDTLDAAIDATADVSNIAASAGTFSTADTNPDTIIWSVGSVAGGTSANLTYDVTIP
jgi:uncharacterized repeat protein (TIGR01451 family)